MKRVYIIQMWASFALSRSSLLHNSRGPILTLPPSVLFVCLGLLFVGALPGRAQQYQPGDVNKDGVVNINDARYIGGFLVDAATYPISSATNSANFITADVTQDGVIDIEDAFTIAKHIISESQMVKFAPLYGRGDASSTNAFQISGVKAGDIVRLEYFEYFMPQNFRTNRGVKNINLPGLSLTNVLLAPSEYGKSLYGHVNTLNLLTNRSAGPAFRTSKAGPTPHDGSTDPASEFAQRLWEPGVITQEVDASCPAPGPPLEFRRTMPSYVDRFAYLGPFGRGWTHSYDIFLTQYQDGMICLHGGDGSGRYFTPVPGAPGTYSDLPGDYGVLTYNSDGTFTLVEKNGLTYGFRGDLRLSYITDPNGNRITAVYNSVPQLVEVDHSSGNSLKLEYNVEGQIVQLTDAAGWVTTYDYDGTNSDLLLTKTSFIGAQTEYVYSLGQGDMLDYRLLSAAYPDGSHTHFAYDTNGYLTQVTGTWGTMPVSYSYDTINNVTSITNVSGQYDSNSVAGVTSVQVNAMGEPTWVEKPDGQQYSFSYDNSGNLTAVVDPLFRVTSYSYDSKGNRLASTNANSGVVSVAYDSVYNNPTNVINELGYSTSIGYDSRGNATNVIFADGSKQTVLYDSRGDPIAIADAAGKTTGYGYNAQGLRTSVTNGIEAVTYYDYSTFGEITGIQDEMGGQYVFARDPKAGWLLRRTFPDTFHEDYNYDLSGKILGFTNRAGNSLAFTYDVNGFLQNKFYLSGKSYLFQYEARGLLALVQSMQGGVTNLDTYREYDLSQRPTLVRVAGKAPPQTYDVSYAYSPGIPQRTVMVYPDGYSLRYEYDNLNRLTNIIDSSNHLVASFQYDAAGQRLQRNLGNGTFTTYQYDPVGKLKTLVNCNSKAVPQTSFGYSYNPAGARTAMVTPEGTNSYLYDNAYQLQSVQYSNGDITHYQLNARGDRTNLIVNGSSVPFDPDVMGQYRQYGITNLLYDTNGNLSTKVVGTNIIAQYYWDDDNRLIQVVTGGKQISYGYNYQGKLTSKTIAGNTTRYIWDDFNLICEIDTNGVVIQRCIYGPHLDEIICVNSGGTNYWAQEDALGSIVGATRDDGSLIGTVDFDVYGGNRGSALDQVPQRFAGMWWDDDAGLYYVRARWYDPTTGHFCSLDPLRHVIKDPLLGNYAGNPWYVTEIANDLKQSVEGNYKRFFSATSGAFVTRDPLGPERELNGYSYAFENPINYFDPYGLDSQLQQAGNVLLLEAAGFTLIAIFAPPVLVAIGATAAEAATAAWGVGAVAGVMGFAGQAFVTFGGGFGGGPGGGACPTFIQQPVELMAGRHASTSQVAGLRAAIEVPTDDCLLKSDIPICGVAYGSDFTSYRVEYGAGKNPQVWTEIATQQIEQRENPLSLKQLNQLQGDLDLHGNLATWNTGLGNWTHLPWHPTEETNNLNGVYTIRLVVDGKLGKTAEDRITCEVGCVIAQCLPGTAVSPDHRVTMRFQEQSLMSAFRVYTILPLSDVGQTAASPPSGCELVGQAYRIREPGDKFIKDVKLEFACAEVASDETNAAHVGICQFDSVKGEWVWLPTVRSGGNRVFGTTLRELPSPKAIYALVLDKNAERSSSEQVAPVAVHRPEALAFGAYSSFERDLGTFKPRDSFVGAQLIRDTSATTDGSGCLKLVNPVQVGNFSCTVLDEPFDVDEFPIMSFDYRVPSGTKVDFYLKVGDRWYDVGFTGDPVDYQFKDVNIGNLGSIDNIRADDRWHSTSVDLRGLLKTKTRKTRIAEIALGNWTVGGYMKLDFGQNLAGATLYLDNFRLSSRGKEWGDLPVELVDNFDGKPGANALGGKSGVYQSPEGYFEAEPVAMATDSSVARDNRVMQFSFNTMKPNSYGGYYTSLTKHNLSQFNSICFRIKSKGALPPLEVGIRNMMKVEGKTLIAPYISGTGGGGWRTVRIPLRSLEELNDLTAGDVLFIGANARIGSGAGRVWIDDLCFESVPSPLITDFESPQGAEAFRTQQHGAAVISASVMPDTKFDLGKTNHVCRISYGGSIGLDYGVQGGFSYAAWEHDLDGIDGRPFNLLSFRIRGEKGNETPNFYISDGVRRVCLRAKEAPPITTEWQEMSLPLSFFEQRGMDVTHLDTFQMVFEWTEQSGTVYIDNIRFAKGRAGTQVAKTKNQTKSY